MSEQENFFEELNAYIEKLEKYLQNSTWTESFLLKRRKRELEKIVAELKVAKVDVQEQIKNIGREQIVAKQQGLTKIPDGAEVLYILLNIKNGREIERWEQAMEALPACGFGRPVYLEEKQAQHAVHSQGDSLNSGYVSIYVNKSDIIQDDSEVDSLGQPIVNLKPGAIDSKHVINFVHYNQEVFLYIDKKLIADDRQKADHIEAATVAMQNDQGADDAAQVTYADAEAPASVTVQAGVSTEDTASEDGLAEGGQVAYADAEAPTSVTVQAGVSTEDTALEDGLAEGGRVAYADAEAPASVTVKTGVSTENTATEDGLAEGEQATYASEEAGPVQDDDDEGSEEIVYMDEDVQKAVPQASLGVGSVQGTIESVASQDGTPSAESEEESAGKVEGRPEISADGSGSEAGKS